MAEMKPFKAIQPSEDSNRREASKHQEASKANTPEHLITFEEAERRGMTMRIPPPPPDVCQFCGKTNHRLGLIFGGVVAFWQPSPARCDCDKAVEFWQKRDDAEKAEKEAKRLAMERQAKMQYIEQLIGASGIKKRFQRRTFANFKADTPGREKAFKIARRYADTFAERFENGDGLYIEGTNGTGKTHLAGAISLELINKGIPVICKTSSDLLLDIKKAYETGNQNEESVILDVYKKVDLLVIDDLGKEQCTDWSMSTLYSILNDRYEDMKPTIITTNYGADDLIRALTPKGYDSSKIVAIISRLRETSTVITMAWADYRTTQE